MSEYKLLLPALGEGVMEATVTQWIKNVGDSVEEDESVVEIATDKVDSDVPSPVSGVIKEILVDVNGVAKIGEPLAILEIEGGDTAPQPAQSQEESQDDFKAEEIAAASDIEQQVSEQISPAASIENNENEFYSPLVKSICKEEGISQDELRSIQGSGKDGRVTKDDLQQYISSGRKSQQAQTPQKEASPAAPAQKPATKAAPAPQVAAGKNDEIIEMDRMRKVIAQHMLHSVQTAPHVSSFVEADMTNVVLWRNKNKAAFEKREGEKITFMPIIVQAIVKAIRDFPMINVSVDGDNIIKKKNINIGIAAARPDGNLIVPIVKNADQYNLAGLAKKINDLAARARTNDLKPEEITEGTYTVSNIGSFGNILGTPIIPQPQVAIMAVGSIEKKPAVIETPEGDMIAIRHKMYLSHSYDHRVVDGALGGMFVKRVAEYLESFDGDSAL
ncbi:MAG: dihydrolipoamide acetyltransferase family protein [Weeksellaceae bacterium]|nr:dihydrolipoamide acetyltransferase family protein [Weeksellaceae bacterium]